MRHGHLYRVSLVASDGKKATVTWQIDTHRAETRPYVLRDIAGSLHLSGPEHVLEVFGSWSLDELRAHLCQHTSEQLRPPSMKR